MLKPAQLVHRQAQVLVLGLAMIAVIILGFLGMYHNGLLIGDRIKQTHATDAAAYSGALIQARALNMQAYINIAQVGHQMAMAHLVTLGSWSKWASTNAKSLMNNNPPAWVIGTHFGAKHGTAYVKSAPAASLFSIANQHQSLHQQFIKHDEIVEKVLAKVSYSIFKSMSMSRDKTVEEVIAANYPGVALSHVLQQNPIKMSSEKSIQWQIVAEDSSRFSSIFRPKANYRSLLSDVSGLYKFLGKRDFIKRSLLPVSSRCPSKRHELRRKGETFLDDQGNWQSMDTLSYHALRSNKWIGCYYREYPMGWGWIPSQSDAMPDGVEYTEDPPGDFSSKDFWRWVKLATSWNIFGGTDNPLANSKAFVERQKWSEGGLVPYVDIVNANRQASLIFQLKLTQHNVQEKTLHTHSRAETFFERPNYRSDRRKETANLWHPYWQARLISNK